jgi:hypothetical protein
MDYTLLIISVGTTVQNYVFGYAVAGLEMDQ